MDFSGCNIHLIEHLLDTLKLGSIILNKLKV